MRSLKERFEMPLPQWIEEVNQEACSKIAASQFAALCRAGDLRVMRNAVLVLWPFVDEFPHMLARGCRRLFFQMNLMLTHGPFEVISLLRRGREILREIKLDEEDHRKLWLLTGQVLDLNYPSDFYSKTSPAVEKWVARVDSSAKPFQMFMRFTAIEIIAECISKNLLGSDKFKEILGTRGCRWFKAHTHPDIHAGMTHEELALHLGFTFHPGNPTKQECSETIQEVVDLFLDAAAECVAQ